MFPLQLYGKNQNDKHPKTYDSVQPIPSLLFEAVACINFAAFAGTSSALVGVKWSDQKTQSS